MRRLKSTPSRMAWSLVCGTILLASWTPAALSFSIDESDGSNGVVANGQIGPLYRVDTLKATRIRDADSILVSGGLPPVTYARLSVSRPVTGHAQVSVFRASGRQRKFEVIISSSGKELTLGPFAMLDDREGENAKDDSLVLPGRDFGGECWSNDSAWLAFPVVTFRGEDMGLQEVFLIDLRQCKLVDTVTRVGLGVLDFAPDSRHLVYSDFADLWIVDLHSMTRRRILHWGGYADTGGENYNQRFFDLKWSRLSEYFEIQFESDQLTVNTLRVHLRPMKR